LKKKTNSELVNIGRVGSAVGLRGEFRVTLYARDSENLKEGKVLLLKHANKNASADGITAACCGVRLQKNTPVICIEGVTDRTAAENLRGMEIYLSADELDELPEGEHYVRDIIGYTVRDTASGTDIGTLSDVIQNTAQSILDVRTSEGRQVLIPAVDAFMRGIDDEAEVISVELIPGFI
jgi:16S rRNA processing protein RimM